jgi:glutamine synthetase
MSEVLGPHVFEHFVSAKEQEWADYIAEVHDWEIDRYLASY